MRMRCNAPYTLGPNCEESRSAQAERPNLCKLISNQRRREYQVPRRALCAPKGLAGFYIGFDFHDLFSFLTFGGLRGNARLELPPGSAEADYAPQSDWPAFTFVLTFIVNSPFIGFELCGQGKARSLLPNNCLPNTAYRFLWYRDCKFLLNYSLALLSQYS
jgi:hypothetical protein